MVDNPTGDDVYYEYGAPGAAYNAAGRVTKETVGTLIDQYRYGALGEVVKKTRTIEGKTYTVHWKWDNFGRLRTIVYSNSVIIYYAYDTGGQVKQVFGYYNGTRMDYVNNVYYDEYGSRTTIAYGNGVVSQYSYDTLMHRLVQLKTTMSDSTYQNITYSYDKVGNIVTRSENGIVMSDNTVKNITHHYGYDRLYRLTQADGFIKENGNTVNSYTSTLQYSSIGTIVQKLQTVKIAGENDPSLTYSYNYSYAPTKPHAVAGINDNLTYRYDANGNMTAVYDTAKQFNRILYWDDDNRLTKTVDTTSGASITTQYNYDAKGMRIIKDGPYGKSIYIDTGYVESGASQTTAPIVSNHIFVGNTRVASVVKHTEEKQPSTYFYASDHLGSSSVLTTQQGSYHERIEYLPYGETWVEDKAVSDGYTTPYKFTGKELDAETGLYYFGARYYDARVSRWISADPALAEGKYFPKPNDYDTEHDFYWYLQQDGSKKLPGLGGVFNAVNMDVYHYAGDNPVKLVDPDGEYAIIDDIIFAGGGALIGLGSQAIGDMMCGNLSGWEDYTASGLGGAAAGWSLLYIGPVGAGAIGGATTNIARQGIKIATGKQKEVDVAGFVTETATGAVLGKIPGQKVAGITKGKGSLNSIFKQMTTKLKEGTISSLKPKTALKMFKGRAKDTAFLESNYINSMINVFKEFLPKNEDKNKK